MNCLPNRPPDTQKDLNLQALAETGEPLVPDFENMEVLRLMQQGNAISKFMDKKYLNQPLPGGKMPVHKFF